MPSTLFQGVTIHELGHAWLVVHNIRSLPLWAEEGFCEILSYRYYSELATDESRYHAKNIEQNPNPVYGNGFRRICAQVDAMGFGRFVETLRTTKQLSSG
jgi:Protein DA1